MTDDDKLIAEAMGYKPPSHNDTRAFVRDHPYSCSSDAVWLRPDGVSIVVLPDIGLEALLDLADVKCPGWYLHHRYPYNEFSFIWNEQTQVKDGTTKVEAVRDGLLAAMKEMANG